jgi:hypothetical protein
MTKKIEVKIVGHWLEVSNVEVKNNKQVADIHPHNIQDIRLVDEEEEWEQQDDDYEFTAPEDGTYVFGGEVEDIKHNSKVCINNKVYRLKEIGKEKELDLDKVKKFKREWEEMSKSEEEELEKIEKLPDRFTDDIVDKINQLVDAVNKLQEGE